VAGIDFAGRALTEAYPPQSVTIRLADEIDISRGDMICRPNNTPTASQDVEAMICWFSPERPMTARSTFAIKHTSRVARCQVKDIRYRLDVNSLSRDDKATELTVNEIGRVVLRTTVPLLYDEYRRNRTTGSFILIDEATNATLGAGMIIAGG
jgi:bifunctional enzyme CysN/CysC